MGLSAILHDQPYDPWKVRVPVKLSDEVLKMRAGRYVSDEVEIFFEVKDGRLIEKLPNGLELPLLAESDRIFYLENFNTSFHFTREKGVERVVIHEHGKDFILRKVY
jgi:hypothetical protein